MAASTLTVQPLLVAGDGLDLLCARWMGLDPGRAMRGYARGELRLRFSSHGPAAEELLTAVAGSHELGANGTHRVIAHPPTPMVDVEWIDATFPLACARLIARLALGGLTRAHFRCPEFYYLKMGEPDGRYVG